MGEEIKEGINKENNDEIDIDGYWSKDKECYMKSLITAHGVGNWRLVTESMNRGFPEKPTTEVECKEHWYNNLDPSLTKKQWSDKEEFEMLQAHRKCQNKWTEVAKILNARSNNTIKNRFYSIFRKVKNKIKRSEVFYNSKLELLEIHYMISLMKFYLSHPETAGERKGKRGKDFIYSLLRNLKINEIERYLNEFTVKFGKVDKIEDLWDELARELLTEQKKIDNPEKKQSTDLTLPQPNLPQQNQESALTPEEKNFIFSQMFNK